MLEPVECFHVHLHVIGLAAGEVVGHGPEHAVAILADEVADLEVVQVAQSCSHLCDPLDGMEVWPGVQRLAGWQCDGWRC